MSDEIITTPITEEVPATTPVVEETATPAEPAETTTPVADEVVVAEGEEVVAPAAL